MALPPTHVVLSSASAGSGENRLDRRGEAEPVLPEPVLMMLGASSDESPMLWLRLVTSDVFLLREGGLRARGHLVGFHLEMSVGSGVRYVVILATKECCFRGGSAALLTVTTGSSARAMLLYLRRGSTSSSEGVQFGAVGAD